MIRLTEIRLDEGAEQLALQVLRSGRLTQGPMVERFEREFAQVAGASHAIAMSSGTTALVAAIQALGLGPGDEVITTPFTFVATLNAVLEAGAAVRLVDIDASDYTIDPEAVAPAVGDRTRAVIPVHLYGFPADMEGLEKVIAGTEISLIEDAAQAHGARISDRPVGSWGMAMFSFYATKNVTTGEGGIVTTSSDVLADKLRLLRNQGMRRRYEYEVPGHNYRMTEIQAAIGIAQLAHLSEWTDRRRRNAARLVEALEEVEGVRLPSLRPERRHVFHQFTVQLDRDTGLDRDTVAAAMEARGIETGVYYPRLSHDYPCYRALDAVRADPTPRAARAAQEVLSLPVHQWLTEADVMAVADTFVDSVRQTRRSLSV